MTSDSLARAKIEEAEEWDRVDIPPFVVPAGWTIKLVPPFAGAMARMIVTNAHGGKVSVYFDAQDALGVVGFSYWEIYPIENQTAADVADNTQRFFGEDITDLVAAIDRVGDPVRAAVFGLTGELA